MKKYGIEDTHRDGLKDPHDQPKWPPLEYTSNSPNFTGIINGVLMRRDKGFKRAALSQYATA